MKWNLLDAGLSVEKLSPGKHKNPAFRAGPFITFLTFMILPTQPRRRSSPLTGGNTRNLSILQRQPAGDSMKKFAIALCASLLFSSVAFAEGSDVAKLNQRIAAAHAVLHELMNTPDRGIPLDIAAKAQCVAVVPGFKKGAFIVGGQYGQGVATCRTGHGWSAPVFIQMTGASFGFQAGGQSTDLVLIGLNRRSMDDLLKDKVKLGGDAAVAAGPVGRNSQAATTELANAEFLTYSRSKGVFAGLDLTGDVVNQNGADTENYYGKEIGYRKVLSGSVPTPAAAQHFVATVNQMFRRGEAREASK
jgi:lipid-binding SYLF domain-containing protein